MARLLSIPYTHAQPQEVPGKVRAEAADTIPTRRNRAKVRLERMHAIQAIRGRLNETGRSIDDLESERRELERAIIEQARAADDQAISDWSAKLKELEESLQDHYLMFDALMAHRERVQLLFDQKLATLREN